MENICFFLVLLWEEFKTSMVFNKEYSALQSILKSIRSILAKSFEN